MFVDMIRMNWWHCLPLGPHHWRKLEPKSFLAALKLTECGFTSTHFTIDVYFISCRCLPHLSNLWRHPWWRPATRIPHRASKLWAHRNTQAPPLSLHILMPTPTHMEATCHITAITAVTTATHRAHRHLPPHPEDGRHNSSQSKYKMAVLQS